MPYHPKLVVRSRVIKKSVAAKLRDRSYEWITIRYSGRRNKGPQPRRSNATSLYVDGSI